MDPVEIPQGECCKGGWVVNDRPVFMDKRKEHIHELGHIIKMRGQVIPDSYRSLAVATTATETGIIHPIRFMTRKLPEDLGRSRTPGQAFFSVSPW